MGDDLLLSSQMSTGELDERIENILESVGELRRSILTDEDTEPEPCDGTEPSLNDILQLDQVVEPAPNHVDNLVKEHRQYQNQTQNELVHLCQTARQLIQNINQHVGQ